MSDSPAFDASSLESFPDHENISNYDQSSGYVLYNSESELNYLSINEDTDDFAGSVHLYYKDGSSEEEYSDGQYNFMTADGISYQRDTDGNTKISKSDETSGKTLSHTKDADGGWDITVGTTTAYYQVTEEGDKILDAQTSDFEGHYRYEDSRLNIQHQDGTYLLTDLDGSKVSNYGSGTVTSTNDEATIFVKGNGSISIDPTPDTRLSFDDYELWQPDGTITSTANGFMSIPKEGIFFEYDVDGPAGLLSAVTSREEGPPNPSDVAMGDYPSGYGDIVINDDGSQTLSRTDGYEFTWFEDGHMEGTGPELNGVETGSQSFYPNATGDEVSYQYNFPDLDAKGIAEDAQFTQYADGSAAYQNGDNQTSWSEYPPEVGTEITFQMADGSYGKEIITRITDDDLGDVSNSITMVYMPGNDSPFISTAESGQFTEDGYSTFNEYSDYTLNEDGSLDTLSGLHIDALEKPIDLAEPPSMTMVDEPSFAWEENVIAPDSLLNMNFYDNDEIKHSVDTDLQERSIATADEQASGKEDVFADAQIDSLVENIVTTNDDGSVTTISDVGGTIYTSTVYTDGSEYVYTDKGHHQNYELDSNGNYIDKGHYYTEPSEFAGSFTILTDDNKSIEYNNNISPGPFFNITHEDGSSIQYDSKGKIDLINTEGDLSSYSPMYDLVSYSLADGSSYGITTEGEVFGAKDSKGYDSNAYLDENGDIQVIETTTTVVDGKITVNVDTEGKNLITQVDNYEIPGMAEKQEMQQLVMDNAPNDLLESMVKYAPEEMSAGLANKIDSLTEAEQDSTQTMDAVNDESELSGAMEMYSSEWWNSAESVMNDDGSTTTTYGDGSVETMGENWTPYSFKGADGSENISNEDGSGYSSDGQGNTSTWNTDLSNSWTSSDGTSGTYNADGTSSTTFADGTTEYYDMMGQLTGSADADGNSIELTTPAAGVYPQDDGSTETWFEDGSHSIESPWGSTETYFTDGSYKYESDGYESMTYEDGSGYSDSGGYYNSWDADGNSYWEDSSSGDSGYNYSLDNWNSLSINSDGSMSGSTDEYSWWEQDSEGNVSAYDSNWNSISLDEIPVDMAALGIENPYDSNGGVDDKIADGEMGDSWGDGSLSSGIDLGLSATNEHPQEPQTKSNEDSSGLEMDNMSQILTDNTAPSPLTLSDNEFVDEPMHNEPGSLDDENHHNPQDNLI